MTKKDFIKRVATENGRTIKEVTPVFDMIFDELGKVLIEGEYLTILGFGRFDVVMRKARAARNPQNGEIVMLPTFKAVKFKPCEELKKAVKE